VSQPRDTGKWSVLATSAASTNSFLNYAIPDDGAIPSLTDVKALIATYEGADPAPGSAMQLCACGRGGTDRARFTVEGRLPLMTCTRIQSNPSRSPDIELIVPVSDAELLATVTVQNEAYGDSAPSPKTVNAAIPWWQVELRYLLV